MGQALGAPGQYLIHVIAIGNKVNSMPHSHSSEYQLKIVYADGTEELSVWMNSKEQITQAVSAIQRPQGKAYWLRQRSAVLNGIEGEQQILEYPIATDPCARTRPHDSGYLLAVGSRDRHEVFETASRYRY